MMENNCLSVDMPGYARTKFTVYIHHLYHNLYEEVTTSSNSKVAGITGNPGTGKSCFGFYAAHREVVRGGTVYSM